MQRTRLLVPFLVVSTVGALVGCAFGTESDLGVSGLQALPAEAGNDDEASTTRLPPSTEDAGEPKTDGGAASDGGDGGGSADAGKADAGADAGSASCASPNACVGATDLGSISGDTGAGVKTAQGSGSQWFKIRISEDDSGVLGTSLLAKAQLTSPPGTNFDLHMYVASNSGGATVECSSVTKSSTTTGADSATAQWGEGALPNGGDDGRNVTVEVRWVSGTCTPSAKWTLTVRGNTP
jgi:hypothetical protein